MEITKRSPLQIIMANEPRVLRDMLGKVLSLPERTHVLGEVTNPTRLPLIVELLHPDWVVLTLQENGSFPSIADEVIERSPETGLLGVAENGELTRARRGACDMDDLALKEMVDLVGSNS